MSRLITRLFDWLLWAGTLFMCPAYVQSSATLSLQCLYPGSSVDVFSAEAVTTAEYSEAVALSNHPPGGNTPLGVDILFSAAPGNFEFDIKFASNDAKNGTAGYSLPVSTATPTSTWKITQADLDPVNQSVHIDLPYVNARSVLAYVASAPANPCNVTLTFKR
jgi:hypothetical protein